MSRYYIMSHYYIMSCYKLKNKSLTNVPVSRNTIPFGNAMLGLVLHQQSTKLNICFFFFFCLSCPCSTSVSRAGGEGQGPLPQACPRRALPHPRHQRPGEGKQRRERSYDQYNLNPFRSTSLCICYFSTVKPYKWWLKLVQSTHV